MFATIRQIKEKLSDTDDRTRLWVTLPIEEGGEIVDEIPIFFDTMELTEDYERLHIRMKPTQYITKENCPTN